MTQTKACPGFREALGFWLRLGFISFGGPAGQIAIMHEELVERRRWIGEERFLHALNFCMLLPGPEATQLATYCGWLMHRTWGGIAAGVLFVLPSALLLWGLSLVYVLYGQLGWVAAVFAGLKPAVTAIVVSALVRIGRRTLRTAWHWALAAGAFVAIFFLRIPFPAIVAAAGLAGWLVSRRWPGKLSGDPGPGEAPRANNLDTGSGRRATFRGAAKVLTVCAVLWTAPVIAAGLCQGWRGTLVSEGTFFGKAAVVTFGGAYAVLPYVGQQAVDHHGWLTSAQMLDGLGLAETTPGPLIMVVQFVGFLGGWNHPGGMSPLLAATLGAAMATWTTFVPCFAWIFAAAPLVETMRGKRLWSDALGAVTAAVVGVILNLAVWFGWQVVRTGAGGVDWFALVLMGAAFVALQRFKSGLIPVLAGCAAAGWLHGIF
jgi:chromate transporter